MEKSECDSSKCPFLNIVHGLFDAKMEFLRSVMPEDKFDKYLKVKKNLYKSCIGVMECKMKKVEKMIDDLAVRVAGHDEEKDESENRDKGHES